MEVSDVRRRLRGGIDDAKRRAAERRLRVDDAVRQYERFLADIATPAFHAMAQALVGEGFRFKVQTPGQAVRLVPDRASEEYVEIALDTVRDVPAVMARSVRGRGRRMLSSERPVAEDRNISDLTDEDVVTALVEELIPFIER
jgi:hypothetical protein